jgi:hypothetical protein
MATRDLINEYLKSVKGLQSQVSGYNPDVTLGLYGEQSRMSQMVGSGIAAAGGGTRGTMNKLPLFNIASDFAAKRMEARSAAQQARLLNLMRVSDLWRGGIGMSQQEDMYQLQKKQQKYDQAFNWGDLLGLVNVGLNYTIPGAGTALNAGLNEGSV